MAIYGWLLDPKRCIECRACESACKQWNNVDTGINVRYRRVRTYEIGKFPQVRTLALSGACNHCDNPLCLKACPTKAYYRRPTDGAILIDPNKCVGCRFCERFCPYGAPQYNVTLNKMQKCTMCWDRIERQMEPACAAICPTAALQFKRFDEIKDAYSTTFEKFSTPATTTPAIRFVTTDWKKG